jgi:hypothetical protein
MKEPNWEVKVDWRLGAPAEEVHMVEVLVKDILNGLDEDKLKGAESITFRKIT